MILYILFFKPIKAAIPQGGFQSINQDSLQLITGILASKIIWRIFHFLSKFHKSILVTIQGFQ